MSNTLLHISSAGRSGSTLLGMALNAHTSIFYGGEISSLWNDAPSEALCSCGETLTECPVWKAAIAAGLSGIGSGGATHARELRDDAIRFKSPGGSRRASAAAGAAAYREMTGKLYQSLASSTRARVIVDSSQHIAHTLLTSELPEVAPRIIHLVRDPRAVVYSWSRARTWPTRSGGIMLQRGALTAIRGWVTHNMKLMGHLSRSRVPHLLLRYEDFAEHPADTMRKVLTFVGEDTEASAGSIVLVGETHIIRANPLRFHRGALSITPDDEWMTALSPRVKLAVTVMTYPLLRRFGYAARVTQPRADQPV